MCGVEPAGPLWLTEGEPIEIALSCREAGFPADGGAFALEPLPAGASYDPATATLSWTPGLDQAAVYDIAVSIPSAGEEATLRIGVADRFDDPANVPVVDPAAYPLEYGLPVLFLAPAPSSSEVRMPVEVIYRGQRLSGAEAKLRGRTSLDFPKNSYTLRFPNGARFSDPERDFLNKRRVVLISTFDDTSYVRARLAFDLWNALSPRIPVQSYMAVVYLDGRYHGLYTVADHIDGDLMVEHGLLEHANLYKAINHDANFRLVDRGGDPKQTLHDGYEKKEGVPEEGEPGAFADLEALVQLVGSAPDGELASRLDAEMDVDEYIAWWLMVQFLGADDNAGKNTYHYRDEDTPWIVIPWDFSASAGQLWTTERRPADAVDDYAWANELFVRMADIEPFASRMAARMDEALSGPFSPAAVEALLDGYRVELPPEAIARDQVVWSEAFTTYYEWDFRTDFQTPAGELAYVRDWLAERHAVLADVF